MLGNFVIRRQRAGNFNRIKFPNSASFSPIGLHLIDYFVNIFFAISGFLIFKFLIGLFVFFAAVLWSYYHCILVSCVYHFFGVALFYSVTMHEIIIKTYSISIRPTRSPSTLLSEAYKHIQFILKIIIMLLISYHE